MKQVLSAERIANLRAALQQITVREELIAYIVDLVRATRGLVVSDWGANQEVLRLIDELEKRNR